ncbi:MAG: sulfatase [Candidatus Latescibacteria bacterium]|nr:sulfatase [Candidatus Latescibacterota bacterium]
MNHNDPFLPMTLKRRLATRRDRLVTVLRRTISPPTAAPRREGPPNLLLLAVDTLRADHMGAACAAGPLTPAMDAVARDGLRFADANAPAPWTLPSFASAFTGLMPCLHGAGMRGGPRNMAQQAPARLRDGATTLAGHLAGRGYRTGAIYSNPFVGFGLAESFQDRVYRNHAAPDVAALALDWIRRRADRPFCAFVLFNDAHEPTMPPRRLYTPLLEAAGAGGYRDAQLRALARWGDESVGVPHLGRAALPLDGPAALALAAKKALYAASVRHVDESLGTILDRLEDWGLATNTLVMIWSDHGEEFLEHAAAARLWDHDPRDLRAIGHGHTQFQELLHVPWLVRGPGVPAGAVRDRPVSLCDLAPTAATWLDQPPLPLPASAPASLLGRAQPRDGAGNSSAERILLSEDIAYGPDLVGVRAGPWKLIARRRPLAPLALFHLIDDPRELRDLSAEQPQRLQELLDAAAVWNRAGGPDDDDRGEPEAAGGWEDLDDRVRRQLTELGYA